MPTLGGGNANAQLAERTPRRARASLLRLPKPLLERVRWTFLFFSLVSGVLLLLAILANHKSSAAVQAMGIVALIALCWLWVEEYRRSLSGKWDLLEGVGLIAVGVAVGNPLY